MPAHIANPASVLGRSRHERRSILCHQTEMTGAEETRKRRHEVDELDRQMLTAGKCARLDDPQLMGSGSLEGLVHKPHSLINNLNPSLDDMPDLPHTSSPVRTEAEKVVMELASEEQGPGRIWNSQTFHGWKTALT
jgi:hypothetical protein